SGLRFSSFSPVLRIVTERVEQIGCPGVSTKRLDEPRLPCGDRSTARLHGTPSNPQVPFEFDQTVRRASRLGHHLFLEFRLTNPQIHNSNTEARTRRLSSFGRKDGSRTFP